MTFLLKRDSSPVPASASKTISKPSRRITKEDISRPTLLPWEMSQSLPVMTSTLKDNMRGHKRGNSEPFPSSHGGLGQANEARRVSGAKRIILSALPFSFTFPLRSPFPRRTGQVQSIQVMIPINTNKPLPLTPKFNRLSLSSGDVPQVTVTGASPTEAEGRYLQDAASFKTYRCNTIEELIGMLNASIEYTKQSGEQMDHEEAQEEYAQAFGDIVSTSASVSGDLEPAMDDKSSVRPHSIASTLKPPRISMDDSSVKYDAVPMHESEDFVEEVSKRLTMAGYPHRIEEVEECESQPSEDGDSSHTLVEEDTMRRTLYEGDLARRTLVAQDVERPIPDGPVDIALYFMRHDMDLFEDLLHVSEERFVRGSIIPTPDNPFRRHVRQRSMEEHFQLELRRKGTLFRQSFALEDPLLGSSDLVDEPEDIVDELEETLDI